MLTPQDIIQIGKKGIAIEVIEKQIQHFVQGFPYIKLDRPAVPSDGIISLSEIAIDQYVEKFNHELPGLRVVKFVPASGAASRMFKFLFEFRDKAKMDQLKIQSEDPVFTQIREIAFYDDLRQEMLRQGLDLNHLIENREFSPIVDYILTEKGLDYANLPKGLITFHRYPEGARTAAEEHMVEAAEYTRDERNFARLHFTISPEHRNKFIELFARIQSYYEAKLNVKFNISFSIQDPSTDILAVDENNQPFRNPDQSLMFRPGGHGALLKNLQDIDADLVFIKNIDNIVPDRLKSHTFRYKKLLGGYLLTLKEQIDKYLKTLLTNCPDSLLLDEMVHFAKEKLFLTVPKNFYSLPHSEQCSLLFNLLNRPVRVCGMVKNEGEPGGGPFWVIGNKDVQSLQIIESSQINLDDAGQRSIFSNATHFNPVDLVCCIKDFTGKRFLLSDYVDENTGFISKKSSGGKTVKAQELPGLWNGAMAGWITIFIEVPIITFNPVKTVNDLLRKEHLNN